MVGEIVVIDGIRYRIEEAEARGLIGERPVAGQSRALSLTAAQVDVDALVGARVAKHEADLDAAFAARVEARVAEVLAEREKATPDAAEEPGSDTPPAEPVKPANRAAKPATK